MRLKLIACGRRKGISVVKIILISLILLLVYQWYTFTRDATTTHQELPDKTDNVLKFDGGDAVETDKKDEEVVPKCGNQNACKAKETSIHLKSGYSNKLSPSVCIDDKYIIAEDGSYHPSRGMNIAAFEESGQGDVTMATFDLYEYDSQQMILFLKSVKDRQILVVVTYDDAANQLSNEARKIFMDDFGSTLISKLNYRGNWIFIGQKGVPESPYHYEEVYPFNKEEGEWAKQIEIEGCTPPISVEQNPKDNDVVEMQSTLQCGLTKVCSVSSIAVRVHSGYFEKKNKILPSICVNGDVVLGTNVHTPGRGISLVIVNPTTKAIEKIATFDTYESELESSKLAKMIESASDGSIVIGTTYDEASHQLTYEAKNALISAGSGEIHNLDYRSSWAFIGQKGLLGATPYEKIADREDLGWAPKVEVMACIPQVIKPAEGTQVLPNNKRREVFCKQYEGYGDFCSEENVKKLLRPTPLDDESLKNNPVFSTPIVVVPGVDLNALRRTFDSLLKVPGLNPQMVMVGNDGDFAEPISLTQLYGFRSEKLQVTTKYQYHMHKAIAAAFVRFPRNQYVIVLEEQLEVSPDFLNYFAQTLPLMDKDDSIISISAWNSNGYLTTSGDTGALYRTENFPGLGWVLRRSVWNEMLRQLGQCCDARVWHEWLTGESRKGREMIVPDVSRLTWFSKDTLSPDQDFIDVYFANRRSVSDSKLKLRDVGHLVKDEYEKEISLLVEDSVTLDSSYTESCLQGETNQVAKLDSEGEVYAIFYEEKDANDQHLLKRLCKCFGLFSMENYGVKGMHKGMLRFHYQGNQVMLISSRSPYYTKKGKDIKAIQIPS
ncbi:protein O-linked-mannose beta-1,2-N-acetylglucosaminyltransferase 1-like [Ptychodera flava]|uniref:protein O-linked-mannose beta-1,2-N-acetylglucosaminyltransferase 1-like n=1 Tax=Ptychodera flava TaxID=63121 RepID=UPI00396AAF03